jgi:hypothetical protein
MSSDIETPVANTETMPADFVADRHRQFCALEIAQYARLPSAFQTNDREWFAA